MSEYYDAYGELAEAQCTKCQGSGKCDDADPGDISFREWTCPSCKGTGLNTEYKSKQSRIAQLEQREADLETENLELLGALTQIKQFCTEGPARDLKEMFAFIYEPALQGKGEWVAVPINEHAVYKKVADAARICNDLVRQNSKDMKAIVAAGENLQQALDELSPVGVSKGE